MTRFVSYANVASTLALVVALGGTSYAAITLPKNSVGSTQIKASAVKTADIGANAVTGAKVKNGSLLAADFAAGQLPAGATGPMGPIGPTGVAGPAGPAGLVPGTIVRRADHSLANGEASVSPKGNVACHAGEIPIGGGANFDDIDHDDGRLTGMGPRTGTVAAPTVAPDGAAWTVWRATAVNPAGGSATPLVLRVFVICVPAPA